MRVSMRTVVGIVTAISVWAALSVPVGAAAGTVTGGTIEVAVPAVQMPVVGAPNGCANQPPAPVINMNFAGNGAAGTWNANGGGKVIFTLGGGTYQLDVLIIAAAGTYAGMAPNYGLASVAPNHVTLQFTIFALVPPNCMKNNQVCQLRTRVVLTSLSGVVSPGMPAVAPGDTAVLDGDSAVGGAALFALPGACQAPPFNGWIGSHVKLQTIGLSF